MYFEFVLNAFIFVYFVFVFKWFLLQVCCIAETFKHIFENTLVTIQNALYVNTAEQKKFLNVKATCKQPLTLACSMQLQLCKWASSQRFTNLSKTI